MSNLSGFVKRLRDIMRNDAGINGDAQRIEQIAWMLFLKVYDAKEQDWEFDDDSYTSIIPEECRWANWAVDDKSGSALTGDRLLGFINNTLFPVLTATHNREIYNNARSRTDSKTQCCKINIEKCLPQPAMDVSFEDILDFKVRRKDELLAFRTKIRELEANIYNADSVELIKHYEAQFVESWENCFNDFYKVLKEAKIRFLLGSLISIVATPFVGKVLSQYLGSNLSDAIQTGAAVINIGIGHFDYKNKISPVKTDGGFSYIIKANRDGIIHI